MKSEEIIIGVDCGGTFTDAVGIRSDEIHIVKVPTTPHDLTVGFFAAIKELSDHWGMQSEDLLVRTASIKFATTIGTNTIIQKTGPKIGLVLTKGAFEEIFSDENIGLRDFVPESTVVEVTEEIDSEGKVMITPDDNEVTQKIETLLDNGARRILISLRNADINPTNEKLIGKAIDKNYPKHSLGSVPKLLSTQVTTRQGYVERTNTAAINSYLHNDMARFLYKAQDLLNRQHFKRPLLIGHSGGGVARVAKTQSINTFNSGPASGVYAARVLSSLYPDIKQLITADLGGTSLDLGFISKGEFSYELRTDIGGIPCHVFMIEVANMGIGGGSIATLAEDRINVGPRSAGATPGPACFDLGGVEPTVTDCDVILGYIDPSYFLGGKLKLNQELAVRAVNDFLAEPLGKTVQESAEAVRTQTAVQMAQTLRAESSKVRNIKTEDSALIAFGGAGPTHCCSFAELCGIEKIIIPNLSSAFSAFGLTCMDVSHFYEKNWVTPPGISEIITAAEALLRRALSDMRGEGFCSGGIDVTLQFLGEDRHAVLAVGVPTTRLDQSLTTISDLISANAMPKNLRTLIFHTAAQSTKPDITHFPLKNKDPNQALLKKREAFIDGNKLSLPVFSRIKLEPGNEITGPAIVEAPETTYVVEKLWSLSIDTYNNAILTKEK